MRSQTGRECPRVELASANDLAAEVLGFTLDERLRPLVPDLLRDSASWLTADERRSVLMRVRYALGQKRVNDALYPERKKRSTTGRG